MRFHYPTKSWVFNFTLLKMKTKLKATAYRLAFFYLLNASIKVE